MPTAWETLTANSTLETGTAWQHLQNQGGVGLPGERIVVEAAERHTLTLGTISNGLVQMGGLTIQTLTEPHTETVQPHMLERGVGLSVLNINSVLLPGSE